MSAWNFIDLTGMHFGRLTVISRGPDHISPSAKQVQWYCKCSCGNPELILVNSSRLRTGHTRSCGCFALEIRKEQNKKHNRFEIQDDYVIGYTSPETGELPFVFDRDMLDQVSQFYWDKANGYISTTSRSNGKSLYLHRLVMSAGKGELVDHINHDLSDNRRCNLRIATKAENAFNSKPHRNNSSGVTGVNWNKKNKKWEARIKTSGKTRYIGSFQNIQDAIEARRKAEYEFHGEFSFLHSQTIAAPPVIATESPSHS